MRDSINSTILAPGLPTLPSDPLLTLAIILLAGLGGGAIARRCHLPSVTGQILAGVLLGHSGLALFSENAIHRLTPLTEFALGFIALEIGSHLHFRRLRNAGKRLFLLWILETIAVPTTVFILLYHFGGAPWIVALLLGTIALDTAPATTITLVKESRAKGVLVKTLVAAVALNNITCISLFEIAHGAAQISLTPGTTQTYTDLSLWVRPIRQLFFGGLVGTSCGLLFGLATPLVVRWKRVPIASLVMILLTWGIASAFHVSPLLSCMFLGITLVNLNPHNEHLTGAPFAEFEAAILAIFFTLAGIDLDFAYLQPAGILALLAFAGRFFGKYSAARTSMTIAKATDRVKKFLGLALIPQAGISVGLILIIQQDPNLGPIKDLVLAIGLALVTLNEIVGPVCTRLSFVWAGEAGQDRPRLIDFLHEENIVTDFTAENKDEAIEKLTDLLIHSNHLNVDRDKLLENVETEKRKCRHV